MIANAAGNVTSDPATLNVTTPPAITSQPVGATLNRGDTATFSVTATGTAPLAYQWRKDGVAISGATAATLSIPNLQAANAGLYTVVIANAAGSVTSDPATLNVTTPPAITSQPHAQTVITGGSATFSVSATGGTSLTYQWRKNGTAITGANGPTFVINNAQAADAGNYDVLIANALGGTASSLAQLSVVTASAAPVITAQPASKTGLAGSSIALSVAASGAPSPGYQWRKNGASIPGATSSTFNLGNVTAGDAGSYDVIVLNTAGTVTSSAATVRVFARSYAGIYFGSFSGGLGAFSIWVGQDQYGVFMGYLPGSNSPVSNLSINVNDAGQFSFTQAALASSGSDASLNGTGEPARAAALATVTLNATIAADGTISGNLTGGATATLAGSRSADTGTTQSVAGFYRAGAANSGATALTITNAVGQSFVLTQVGANIDGGTGTVNAAGQVSVTTARAVIAETINVTTGGIAGTATSGGATTAFSGASDLVLSTQRLANISTRARVGTGDSVAIAGFVISGEESKPVLIRAVGPTLTAFGVAGALATPKLELYRGSTVIASNTGVSTGGNAAAIAAAGLQAGGFALGNADSAILITLAPGAYTAIISSSTNTVGVALAEVYDLSAPAPGQKLLNISTRANAGVADNLLIAGVVVTGTAPKRVLIRAVGPGLAVFGLTGVLAQPQLSLISAGVTVAQNTNWTTSTDSTAIAAASTQVGAFPLVAQDSAMIVSLAPGNYTAQVLGVAGGSGIAIIEIYELP